MRSLIDSIDLVPVEEKGKKVPAVILHGKLGASTKNRSTGAVLR